MRTPRGRREERLCGRRWININRGVEKGVNGEGVPAVAIIEAEPGGLELCRASGSTVNSRFAKGGRVKSKVN
jgi:hypothetical protein